MNDKVSRGMQEQGVMDIRAEKFMLSPRYIGGQNAALVAGDNYLDDDNVIWTTRTMSLLTINIIEILPTG